MTTAVTTPAAVLTMCNVPLRTTASNVAQPNRSTAGTVAVTNKPSTGSVYIAILTATKNETWHVKIVKITDKFTQRHDVQLHARPSSTLPDGFLPSDLQRRISPAWAGSCSAADQAKLDNFIRRCKRLGYCHNSVPTISEIFSEADDSLSHSIMTNSNHAVMGSN